MNFNKKEIKIKSSRFSKKNNKKADINIGMSWIFMIIIGSIFLYTAYNIIEKYQIIENEKNNIEIENSLRNILNNIGRTAGIEESSLQPIENIFKNSEVEILCNNNLSILSMNHRLSSNNQFINNYPIFMTYIKEEKIDSTFIAVENFKLPFKITNLVALVSTKNLIVLDKDANITKKIMTKFDKNGAYKELNYILKEKSDLNEAFISEISKNNYNSIMFVSDEGKDFTTKNYLNEINSKAYLLEFKEITNKYGYLNYTTKDGNSYKYNYIDLNEKLAMQTMAIFSAPNTFNCSHNLLINSIEPIYDFYINKSNLIQNISKTTRICSNNVNLNFQATNYKNINTKLNTIITEIKNNRFSNQDQIINNINDINNYHKGIEKNSCIYLY